jgi:hypothetical protein
MFYLDENSSMCEIHGKMTQEEFLTYTAGMLKNSTAQAFLAKQLQAQALRASRSGGK